MIADSSESWILLNYHVQGKGIYVYARGDEYAAHLLNVKSGEFHNVKLEDQVKPVADSATEDVIAVDRYRGPTWFEIAVRSIAAPQNPISKISIRDGTQVFEGSIEPWRHLPNAFIGRHTVDGVDHEYLFLVDANEQKVEVQRLDWYNEKTYDMGYQGLLGVSAIPGSPLLIICIQRDSHPVVYSPAERKVVSRINISDGAGNPDVVFIKAAKEAWADDYDTMVRLNPNDWSVVNRMQLQVPIKGMRHFIGDFCFNQEESLCAVARTFSGDIVALDTKTFELTHRVELKKEPLEVILLSDDTVISREWRTHKLLRGTLRQHDFGAMASRGA